MRNFFTPDSVHMQAIRSEKGVEIFRRILSVLCGRCGIYANKHSTPFNIYSPDGGVDAWVDAEDGCDVSRSEGLINFGYNVYQIKTGTSFSASNLTHLKSLFFDKPGVLKEGVKKCLHRNGTFVAFLFGDINPDGNGLSPEDKIREELAKINEQYRSAKIVVWRADQIAQFLSHFPNISLAIMERDAPVYPIENVMKYCGLDGDKYYETKENKGVIDSLKQSINKKSGLKHIRYIGDPGIGKTRTIYEAISTSDSVLESIYCENADSIVNNERFIQSIIEHAENHPIVLIVDECEPENRSILHRKFRNVNGPMTLITIHNEFNEADRTADIYLEPPKLADEKISQIVQSYDIEKVNADYIAKYCSGSPRVAHIVGQCLRNEPNLTNLTRINGIDDIWEIYIAGPKASQEEKDRRKLILAHLALFRKFGWEGASLRKEADLIYDLIVKHIEPNLSYNDFQNVIRQCKSRRILQGVSTLYITPKLLHIKLWSDWCSQYSHRYEPKELLEDLSGSQLKNWFADMIRYVHESKEGGIYFQSLLDNDGIFQQISDFKDGENGNLFIQLVKVNPKAALRAVYTALGKSTHEELRQFTEVRRTLVRSLEQIALYGECFEGAADLLLQLSVAENETWANNATGVLKDLFSVIATGEAASTDLSPKERLPTLLKYLNSSDKTIRLLAIDIFDEALRASSVTRTIIRDSEDFVGGPKGWSPESTEEFMSEYESYLHIFWKKYQDENDTEEKNKIAGVLLKHVRTLLQYEYFQPFIINMLRELSKSDQKLKDKVIEVLVTSLRYDGKGLGENLTYELQLLHDHLSETDFPSMLRRYVGLNLLEDRYSRNSEDEIVIDEKLDYLAQKMVENPIIIEPELIWLLTDEAKNGFEFGKRLGLFDTSDQLWVKITQGWDSWGEETSNFFLGGYLAGVFERDLESWEAKIHLITNSVLATHLPYLVLRSGMSSNIAKLLLSKSREGLFHPQLFKIYVYGGVLVKFPENTLLEIFSLMLESNDRQCISSALEMLSSLFYNNHMLNIVDKEIYMHLLTHESLFSSKDKRRFGSFASHTWNELALALAKNNKGKALLVLDKCLHYLDEDNAIVGARTEDVWGFLDYCAEHYSIDTWKIIAQNIDPFHSNAIAIFSWLKGGAFINHVSSRSDFKNKPKPFSYLPRAEIFNWIDANPKIRAPVIAHFAPFELSKYDEKPKSFIREFLERYGNSVSVRNALSANYYTESWSGLTSVHLTNKADKLKEYLKTERDKNVKKWLDREISDLENRITEALIVEERNER